MSPSTIVIHFVFIKESNHTTLLRYQ